MNKSTSQAMVERNVTYTLEVEGRIVVVENVPARICEETGEQYFSPETVERLQELIWEEKEPKRTIEVPVFEFA
jgi:YgiT-type zinc finger domain-containing protein